MVTIFNCPIISSYSITLALELLKSILAILVLEYLLHSCFVIIIINFNNPHQSPISVASAIRDFVDTLLFVHGIPQFIVLQTLHRHSPTCHTRYPVDIHWFNNRVDDLNSLLIDWLNSPPHGRAYLWRLKGFWSPECIRTNFADDGCHLSPRGQHRFFNNIRAAVVAALK